MRESENAVISTAFKVGLAKLRERVIYPRLRLLDHPNQRDLKNLLSLTKLSTIRY